MVTEAGASVTFCVNPEALETDSISMDINSSRLLSSKPGMAGLSCAETPADMTSDSSKIAVTIIERRTLERAHAQDNLAPACLAAAFADDVKNNIATSFKNSVNRRPSARSAHAFKRRRLNGTSRSSGRSVQFSTVSRMDTAVIGGPKSRGATEGRYIESNRGRGR